jgi:2-keto-3-deoxy-L-rhamnonate aldolase RhmA
MTPDDLTAAEHLAEARRYAGEGRRAFGEFGDKVDAGTLARAEGFFSTANAHATSALAMLKADEPSLG